MGTKESHVMYCPLPQYEAKLWTGGDPGGERSRKLHGESVVTLPIRPQGQINGADRRIRTLAGFYTPTCFQDTPLQPLEYIRIWSGKRDLNPQQPDWKSGTLPLSYCRI